MISQKKPTSALCFDFSNQFSGGESFDYKNLIIWAKRIGATTNETADQLLELSINYPFKTSPVIYEAKILANTIAHIYSSIARGEKPLEDDLIFLNGSIEKAFQNLIITPSSSLKFHWGWKDTPTPSPDQPLWRVILSAGETLVEVNPKRIKQCESSDCIKLFIDTSKGGRRKWCSMETCGNRAKTQKYRNKTK